MACLLNARHIELLLICQIRHCEQLAIPIDSVQRCSNLIDDQLQITYMESRNEYLMTRYGYELLLEFVRLFCSFLLRHDAPNAPSRQNDFCHLIA